MSRHTPGPWVVAQRNIKTPADGVELLHMDGYAIHVARNTLSDYPEADIALVAAAPELLEALQALVRDIQYCVDDGTFKQQDVDTTPSMIAARAAIAKAEGQS